MKPRITRSGKKLTEVKLAALERKFGIRLPRGYRTFLMENNGGTPEPNGVCRKRKKMPSEVCHYFLQISSEHDYDDWSTEFERMKDPKKPRLPLRLVPIAADPFGNLFCLSVTGRDAGKIYFWHHEEEFRLHDPDGAIPDDSGVSLMADSFEDFLGQFAELPEEEDDDEPKRAPQPWEALIEAGNEAAIRKWLNTGGKLDGVNRRGMTPIDLAIELENGPVLELLLRCGGSWEKAIASALYCRRWSMVGFLLKRSNGKKVKIGYPAFSDALRSCTDPAVIEEMLKAGAPVHQEYKGYSPLSFATMDHANPEIVKLLLKHGAKLHQSRLEMSPLAQSICLGNLETVKILLEAGESLYSAPPGSPKEIECKQVLEQGSGLIQIFTNMYRRSHELAIRNSPKAPAYYLDHPWKKFRSAELAAKFKQDVINYAAQLGQKPETDS